MELKLKREKKRITRSRSVNENFLNLVNLLANELKKTSKENLENGEGIYLMEDPKAFKKLAIECGNLATSTLRYKINHHPELKDSKHRVFASEDKGVIRIENIK